MSLHLKARFALFSTSHRILGLVEILKVNNSTSQFTGEGSSPEKVSDLFKVTQLVSNKVRAGTQISFLTTNSIIFPLNKAPDLYFFNVML